MNSNFKRLVTLLLVAVMLVGMLPMTASAATGGMGLGTGTGTMPTFPPKPGEPTGSWPSMPTYGRFTRYTLVYFPFSDNSADVGTTEIPASQWLSDTNGGEVIGSIDVITEGSFPTDALYLKDKSLVAELYSAYGAKAS